MELVPEIDILIVNKYIKQQEDGVISVKNGCAVTI